MVQGLLVLEVALVGDDRGGELLDLRVVALDVRVVDAAGGLDLVHPGGFVQKGRTFTYVWECPEGTQGTWLYHDHGPWDPAPLYKGLFGPLVIRDPDEPLPDREFFLGFHTFSPSSDFPRLKEQLFAINGRAYTGNTPTLSAKVGDDVAFHVYGIDDMFHTFHIHGHRWVENGVVMDNKTFGPGDFFRVRFIEDNPGRWLYHCHVFSHLHKGMSGWYNVD